MSLRQRAGNAILTLLPPFFVICAALAVSGYCAFFAVDEPVEISSVTPTPFAPASAKPFELLTAPPYRVGQEISIQDGICNKTGIALGLVITLGIQRVGAIAVPPVIVIDQAQRSFAPGCTGGEPLTGPLPPEVTPGRWRIFANLTVMGPGPGEIQRLSIVSPDFDVLP